MCQKKTHISNEELHRKFGIVQIGMRLSSRRLRMVKEWLGKYTRAIFLTCKCWPAISGQTCLDKYRSMTSEGKPKAHATPCEKQFLDDIEALGELHEGDDFVSELNGELRESLFSTCRIRLRT